MHDPPLEIKLASFGFVSSSSIANREVPFGEGNAISKPSSVIVDCLLNLAGVGVGVPFVFPFSLLSFPTSTDTMSGNTISFPSSSKIVLFLLNFGGLGLLSPLAFSCTSSPFPRYPIWQIILPYTLICTQNHTSPFACNSPHETRPRIPPIRRRRKV